MDDYIVEKVRHPYAVGDVVNWHGDLFTVTSTSWLVGAHPMIQVGGSTIYASAVSPASAVDRLGLLNTEENE